MVSEEGSKDVCQLHKKPIEIICIDCKERICSNCALFGNHKPHDIRMEQDVLEEISIRTECLTEMYQMVAQSAAEKPDEVQVDSIYQQFQKKQTDLRSQLKERFKEMRALLKIQEQTTDAILKKNLQYVENELKNLKGIDYRMFEDAEKWLKNAKQKLDNFQANNNNPHYIAFDMLASAKQNDDFISQDNFDDNLLSDDVAQANQKNGDIIARGEKIAELLGQVKAINPNVLSSQLGQLTLKFDTKTIEGLNNVSKCETIEGVEISHEELEALKEAVAGAGDVEVEEEKVKVSAKSMLPPKQAQSSVPIVSEKKSSKKQDQLEEDMARMSLNDQR
mmetsp:Transcript_13169/g.22319  ORF Transcript_13169/g.22319 Transcript_13169/m.22319 type:complete len:335 (-) Transcript_13169:615-1619(-)